MDLTEVIDQLQDTAFGNVKDVTKAEHLDVYIETMQGGPVQRVKVVRMGYDERSQPFIVLSAKAK